MILHGILSNAHLTSTYTILQSANENAIISVPVSPSSIPFTITVVPTAGTTVEGPHLRKPELSPEEYEAKAKVFRDFIASLESDVTAIPTARTTLEEIRMIKPELTEEDYEASLRSFLEFLDTLEVEETGSAVDEEE